jgi:hypothetical protein
MADKSTDAFRYTIEEHLKERAFRNKLFADKFSNPKKNIDDCVSYILDTVQKSGSNGFTDDEVFGMAIHYYSEDDIKVSKGSNATVVINHKKLLTADERQKD